MRRSLLCLFLLTGAVRAADPCFAPAGDWIAGSDLAAALPGLTGLPPALKVSYAPVPGLERVFHPDELRRLALAHGLSDPRLTANVCFAWPLRALDPEQLRQAMARELAGREARIEIVAQSLAQAPAGEIAFPLAGLRAYSENPVIWKGYVLFAEKRRFDIWASVRVRVRESQLKANGPIHAGDRLAPGRWRAETYDGPPLREAILSAPSDAAGLVARRDFADGAPLLAGFFERPLAVEPGDAITVAAENGAARIEASGVALTGGRVGEVIPVRNPRSNRTFKARIASAGRVEVLPGTSAGLAVGGGPNGNVYDNASR